MTLANILTLSRIALIPCIFAASLLSFPFLSALLFVIACLTDYFDGYVAHVTKTQTAFGALLDPLADKLLIILVLFLLNGMGRLREWSLVAAALIIFREIFVMGLRNYAVQQNRDLAVIPLAKWKTALQMLATLFLLLGPQSSIMKIGDIFLWTAALLSVWTGALYCRVLVR